MRSYRAYGLPVCSRALFLEGTVERPVSEFHCACADEASLSSADQLKIGAVMTIGPQHWFLTYGISNQESTNGQSGNFGIAPLDE
jgi:hypothetical protein